MKAVLLAAGRSTRTWPVTRDLPKPLLPILGMPTIGYTVNGLKDIIDEWYVLTNFGAEEVQSYLVSTFPDVTFHFVTDILQGTGSAVRLLSEKLRDDNFLVLNGDDLYHPADIRRLAAAETPNAVLVKEVKDPSRFGVFVTKDGKATALVEKPKEPISNLANTGAYKFSGAIFSYTLEMSPRGEYEITDYVNALIADKKDISLVTVEDYWLPITYPWDVLVAQRWFLSNADVAYRVDPTAKVDGSAFLGKNVYIGKNCVIEEEVELENVCLLEGTHVGAYSRIHASVLAPRTQVAPETFVTPHEGTHELPVAGKDPVAMTPPYGGMFTAPETQVSGYVEGPVFLH